MTTRGGPEGVQQINVKNVTMMFNLCNEPCLKYGMVLVADKGLEKSSFTSARLKRGDVMYLENSVHRYELCFIREKVIKPDSTSQASSDTKESHNHPSDAEKDETVDVYRFSRCKKILSQSTMLVLGIPLPVDFLEVIDEDLDWEDVLWSDVGLWVGGKEYKITRMMYLSPTGVAPIL